MTCDGFAWLQLSTLMHKHSIHSGDGLFLGERKGNSRKCVVLTTYFVVMYSMDVFTITLFGVPCYPSRISNEWRDIEFEHDAKQTSQATAICTFPSVKNKKGVDNKKKESFYLHCPKTTGSDYFKFIAPLFRPNLLRPHIYRSAAQNVVTAVRPALYFVFGNKQHVRGCSTLISNFWRSF